MTGSIVALSHGRPRISTPQTLLHLITVDFSSYACLGGLFLFRSGRTSRTDPNSADGRAVALTAAIR
jgi:hypothetical protein